ncbi:MAG: abortive infection system antitoxin AbiGi family protein [Sulfuricurvum sp.]|uniref:abortive infection system antitoxin AbiGi family protein n=1 Tax=Sulfuricurvum sp. TaxID=2025608 RepID=UPI0026213168|nr:abortive infection system antitoxin AbiGi family protein [Sulfuricurvum sp.]MDD2828347.1 abortive infection system antitoxin AbiGi family protein [Sulfuricurvum sp.]MDD4949352.1 abortive infection system antitoxin AbiGi family protein [Sulfuricurvum sp.]
MGLSSNSIIHFTSTKDSLKGILSNDFHVKYCIEDVILGDKNTTYIAPMVSFCDIPLSEVKNHIENYGSYGIGLSKEWAIKQRLNPVVYVEKKSFFSESLLELFRSTYDAQMHETKATHGLQVFSHIKNYESDLFRKNKEPKRNYRFSDEREWRYIPSYSDAFDDEEKRFSFPSKKEFQTPEQKAYYNDRIKHLKLMFEPNDIKYIIINDESEIGEFIDFLRHVKGKNYSLHDVERLTRRIITTEQIYSDF